MNCCCCCCYYCWKFLLLEKFELPVLKMLFFSFNGHLNFIFKVFAYSFIITAVDKSVDLRYECIAFLNFPFVASPSSSSEDSSSSDSSDSSELLSSSSDSSSDSDSASFFFCFVGGFFVFFFVLVDELVTFADRIPYEMCT